MDDSRLKRSFLALGLVLGLVGSGTSCTILTTRPVQDMSDTAAAIRAAREVQAEVLSPEYYRQANEWFAKARREYKFRNFHEAKEYSSKARRYAEQAEFEAIRANGTRADPFIENPPPTDGADATSSDGSFATPTPVPAESFTDPFANPPGSQAPSGATAPSGPTKIEVPAP
ncbi:MAG: DUF4398 domain-containing protein [Oligoflexia bacterium]|nr:DUF4398 domain-containing protein [Oligoflexia bacterium]